MDPDRLTPFAEPIRVLDHGIVQLLDVMGDDQAVLQAARTSTGSDSKGDEADRKLLRYLFRQKHSTPFESCNIKLFIKLPIFVERQFVRHRSSWLNEVSARYTQLPEEYYIPDPSMRPMAQSKSNKQGSEGGLHSMAADNFCFYLEEASKEQFRLYREALDSGIAKEIARLHLGVNVYTQKVWGTSLRMLVHFLALRVDPHAQWEIRQYANIICEILEAWCPWTSQAFIDYELHAHTFSRQEMDLLREHFRMFGPSGIDTTEWIKARFNTYGVETKRERGAFLRALELIE